MCERTHACMCVCVHAHVYFFLFFFFPKNGFLSMELSGEEDEQGEDFFCQAFLLHLHVYSLVLLHISEILILWHSSP